MPIHYRLLIVDDEPRMCQILGIAARKWGYETESASNGKEALEKIQEFAPEIIISDLKMPTMDGEELLKEVRARRPDTPIIMMTAHGTVQSAVAAMKHGAFDYILKPFDNEELRLTLDRAREMLQLRVDNENLRNELGSRYKTSLIIGESEPINQVLEVIDRVGPTRATVLITGESGTGKELVARALHVRSPRARQNFVAVNCAALTETLLESELFGHEKGAFTGAVRQHRGKFEEADGGTIFLDEIGEVNNTFQTKLLRVLQEGTIERVGGTSTFRVDVRVIAATNRNLAEMVKQGRFREDLFYRLQVVPIELPALRQRPSDIPLLAQHFLRKTLQDMRVPPKVLTDDAMEVLKAAEWRGNVRELENTIERAVILSRSNRISADDLWLPLSDTPRLRSASAETTPTPVPSGEAAPAMPVSSRAQDDEALRLPLAEFVERMTQKRVLAALDASGWRKQEAASALGIDRATLYRMIKKFGIEQDGE